MGDPTGIGPEILARALARAEVTAAFTPVVVGDARIVARGAALAGTAVPLAIEIVDLAHCPPEDVALGAALPRAGRAAGQALERAFAMAARGDVVGVCYAPLHKRSLHDGGYPFEDELRMFAHWTGSADDGEINALERLWTSRVTSHVGLARVAAELSVDRGRASGAPHRPGPAGGRLAPAAHRRRRSQSPRRRAGTVRRRGAARDRARGGSSP